jgi:mono/diheme cytochrome c family protein
MKISIQNRVAWSKLLPAVFFLFGLLVFAVSCSNDKKAAIAIGGEWYKSYCVSCHGENGDGQTQIGAMLNPQPQDLRQIAKRRNGVFPDAEISKIIAGKEKVPGHSTTDMPIWWESFKKAEGVYDDKSLQEKIDQITAYLKTIQVE